MINLFEAPNISGKNLMEITKLLLVEIQLRNTVIACVKDEGKNLTTSNVASLETQRSYTKGATPFKLFHVMCFSWGNFVQVHALYM